MKKVIAWLLVLSLTAAISIGATLAYLTDTDEDVNVMTVGKVKIDQLEYERINDETANGDASVQEFHDNKPLYPAVTDKNFDYTPGDTYVDWTQIGKDGYTSEIWNPENINNEIDKMVFVKNKGDYDAYVRTVFAFEAGNCQTLDEFNAKMHLNLNDTDWTWVWAEEPVAIGESTYFIATATYNNKLDPGALTQISLSQIALDSSATNADVEAFGETYQILVKTQAIQADGFDNAETALNEGFGQIVVDIGTPEDPQLCVVGGNLPFENDDPTTGVALYEALHYLDADGTTLISNKITSVTFCLTAEYADKVAGLDGALVDVEQDVPVYAYYVPNGNYYDVYFLANDVIYAPADSSDLFKDMSNLVSVDTTNLDVSRVENMSNMFLNCKKLSVMDTSDWDVSNVTNMYQMFRNCNAFSAQVGSWDVSKVTNMYGMFAYNYALKELDVSNWQVGNVEDMAAMFAYCYDLTYLDVSKWDTGSVKTFRAMFQGKQNQGNMKINNLDVSNWDTSSCTVMNHMFYSCGYLTSLDMSGWDVSNVTTMSHMFADCHRLKSLNMSGWNTASLICMDAMFNDAKAIEVLDVSDLDIGTVKELCQTFEGCTSLTQIIGLDKWDTSNCCVFEEIFSRVGSLKVLDLSSFDTSSARNSYKGLSDTYSAFIGAFSGMSSLEKLIVSDKISYYGNGTVPEASRMVLPSPAAKTGYVAKWRNEKTGEVYMAKDIPEGVAATYVAYYEPKTTT